MQAVVLAGISQLCLLQMEVKFVYTLDILSANTATIQSEEQPTSVPDAFCSSQDFPTGAALSTLTLLSEKAHCKCNALFLAGALGLEPRAYGFGDRRSTN